MLSELPQKRGSKFAQEDGMGNQGWRRRFWEDDRGGGPSSSGVMRTFRGCVRAYHFGQRYFQRLQRHAVPLDEWAIAVAGLREQDHPGEVRRPGTQP
jgi:hypothetical protein